MLVNLVALGSICLQVYMIHRTGQLMNHSAPKQADQSAVLQLTD